MGEPQSSRAGMADLKSADNTCLADELSRQLSADEDEQVVFLDLVRRSERLKCAPGLSRA